MNKISLFLIVFIFSVVTTFAQTKPSETPLPSTAKGGQPWEVYGQDKGRIQDSNAQVPSDLPNVGNRVIRNTPDYSNEEAKQIRMESYVNKTTFTTFKIEAPQSYQTQYQSLLKDKKYNLSVVAVIDPKCYESKVLSVKDYQDCENALSVWGGGSSFSFRNKTNYDDKLNNWSDIRILNNRFEVGSVRVQGIISEVGDIDLGKINLKSNEVKYLLDFKAEKNYEVFLQQKTELDKGHKTNGFLYSTKAPIKLNSTYLVRSIAYDPSKATWDNRKDLIIAFKILGIESDNNLVILWKELKKSNSPWFECFYTLNGKCW